MMMMILDLPIDIQEAIFNHNALNLCDTATLKQTCQHVNNLARFHRIDLCGEMTPPISQLSRMLTKGECETLGHPRWSCQINTLLAVAASSPIAVAKIKTVYAYNRCCITNTDNSSHCSSLRALLASLPSLRTLHLQADLDSPMLPIIMDDLRVQPTFYAIVRDVSDIDAAVWQGKRFFEVKFSQCAMDDRMANALTIVKNEGVRFSNANVCIGARPTSTACIQALADLVDEGLVISAASATTRDAFIDVFLAKGRIRTLDVSQSGIRCGLFERLARPGMHPLRDLHVTLMSTDFDPADPARLRSILADGATLTLNMSMTFTTNNGSMSSTSSTTSGRCNMGQLLVENAAITTLHITASSCNTLTLLQHNRAVPNLTHLGLFISTTCEVSTAAAIGRRLAQFTHLKRIHLRFYPGLEDQVDAMMREVFKGAPSLRRVEYFGGSRKISAQREGVTEVIVSVFPILAAWLAEKH